MRMRMRGMLLMALLLGAMPAAVQAQQRPGAARRAELERRILEEFLARAAPQAEMTDTQRTHIRRILEESAARHRTRTLSGLRLRRELAEAVRAPQTPDAELTRIMEQIERLRAEEQQAWQADQRAIAEVLSPRQRATFSLRWMEFQERVRVLMGERARRGRGTPERPPG